MIFIVSKPWVKHSSCSLYFIQWYRLWKSSDYLYEMVAGKSRGGKTRREGESAD